METQNITLAIPKDVLHKARRLAVEQHKSLSGLLTELIVDLVRHDDRYWAACERQLAYLERGLDLGTGGNIHWTREELHER